MLDSARVYCLCGRIVVMMVLAYSSDQLCLLIAELADEGSNRWRMTVLLASGDGANWQWPMV